jgi:hypothetical protein
VLRIKRSVTTQAVSEFSNDRLHLSNGCTTQVYPCRGRYRFRCDLAWPSTKSSARSTLAMQSPHDMPSHKITHGSLGKDSLTLMRAKSSFPLWLVGRFAPRSSTGFVPIQAVLWEIGAPRARGCLLVSSEVDWAHQRCMLTAPVATNYDPIFFGRTGSCAPNIMALATSHTSDHKMCMRQTLHPLQNSKTENFEVKSGDRCARGIRAPPSMWIVRHFPLRSYHSKE